MKSLFLILADLKKIAGILLLVLAILSCSKKPSDSSPALVDLLPDWGNQIIYQVMIDRFYSEKIARGKYDSDDMNRYQGGDLDGVIRKLDYIKSLGATAILLNPVTDADDYHGYSVKDLFKVNPHFGTDEDYRRLVNEVHRRGMKIIFDFVANHESSMSDNLNSHPDWFRPIERARAINDVDINEVWSKMTFYNLRDLKQENEEVYQYLLKAAQHWSDFGIDGLRMDAGSLIQPEFFKRFTADVKKHAGSRFLVMTELFFNDIDRLNTYASYMDGAFDFRLNTAIADLVKHQHSPKYFKVIMDEDRLITNPLYIPFTFIDNHDVGRFVEFLPPKDREKMLELALTLLFTIRGVPTVLYGTEVAMDNEPQLLKGQFDRSRRRMVFDHNEAHPAFKHIQRLAEIRREFDFNSKDRSFVLDGSHNSVVTFIVRSPKQGARIVSYNFSNKPLKFEVNLNYVAGIPKSQVLPNLLDESRNLKTHDGYATFDLGGYETAIYRIGPLQSGP